MSKELEALERIIEGAVYDNIYTKQDLEQDVNTIKQALQRLESLDNSNPSEALECLENIEADLTGLPKHVTEYDDGFDNYLEDIWYRIDTIKQALIKAQEQEKEIDRLDNQCLDLISDNIRLKNKAQEKEKVLEIIFEKGIDIGWLRQCKTVEEYNYHCEAKHLTQEEFELLKKWLERNGGKRR